MNDPSESGWPGGDEWRQRLEAEGFRPSRRLGQNFLVDPGRCAAIAALAEPLTGAFVLEIGVGLGFLTRHLLERGACVVGVEVDRRLAELALVDLERTAQSAGTTYRLIVADALEAKSRLARPLLDALPASGAWQVVSNLPYSIASPVIALLGRVPNPPSAMTVLIQREVADRLAATPGSADWGALSVRVQAAYRARIALRVPPGAFRPRPKVDSAVVRLERRPDAPNAELATRLDGLVGAAFGQRRKRLRNTLAPFLGGPEHAEALCRSHGVDPAARPQELPLAAFLELARVWPLAAAPPLIPEPYES